MNPDTGVTRNPEGTHVDSLLPGLHAHGVMNVLPPKESRFLYPLPARPNRLLPAAAVILIPADIFLFGPGICYP